MRLHHLDSLRGLAALQVALFHSLTMIKAEGAHWQELATCIFLGPNAVCLFFVLSGFVLGLSLDRSNQRHFWGFFLLKRLLRLVPTCILACLFTVALFLFFSWDDQLFFGWFYKGWPKSCVEPANIVTGCLLAECVQIPPLWSIQVEMIAAIAFPLLWLLMRRVNVFVALVILAAVSLAGARLISAWTMYGAMFAMGLLIPRIHPVIASVRVPNIYLVAFCLGTMMYFCAYLSPIGHYKQMAVALGAGLVMLSVTSGRSYFGSQLLNWNPLRWLGKVSFSFYVYHWISLFLTSYAFGQYFGLKRMEEHSFGFCVVMFGASCLVCAVLSWASWVGVEKPSLRLIECLSLVWPRKAGKDLRKGKDLACSSRWHEAGLS